MRRRALIVGLGVAVVAAHGVGVAIFQPQKLFIDDVVDKARPGEATPNSTAGIPDASAPPLPTVPPVHVGLQCRRPRHLTPVSTGGPLGTGVHLRRRHQAGLPTILPPLKR